MDEQQVWKLLVEWKPQRVELANEACQSDERYRHLRSSSWLLCRWEDDDAVDLDSIRHLRECLSIWHLISCCPGYGRDTNLVFWSRIRRAIFGSMVDSMNCLSDTTLPIAAVVFDCGTTKAAALLRLFFLLDTPSEEYLAVLKRLRPHLPHPVQDVKIGVQCDPSIDALVNEIAATMAQQYQSGMSIVKIVKDDLTSVTWNREHCALQLTYVDAKKPAFDDALVQLLDVRCTPSESSVGRLGRLDLRVHLEEMHPFHFASLCSALPYTQALETLRVDYDNLQESKGLRRKWQWLVYALSHPATKHSSWKRLELRGTLPRSSWNMLWTQAVQFGFKHGMAPLLVKAHEPPCQVVRVRRSSEMWNRHPLLLCDGNTMLEDIELDVIQTGPDNVVVVLPGYGDCLVAVGDVLETRLTTTRATCCTVGVRHVTSVAQCYNDLTFCAAFGEYVTSWTLVDARSHVMGSPYNRQMISAVIKACSNLQELVLYGTNRSHMEAIGEWLSCDNSNQLKTMALAVTGRSDLFRDIWSDWIVKAPFSMPRLVVECDWTQEVVEAWARVLTTNQRIEQLVLVPLQERQTPPVSLVRYLEVPQRLTPVPFPLSSRLAMISAVLNVNDRSALGRLDAHVLSHIFAFAGQQRYRHVLWSHGPSTDDLTL